VGAWGGIKSSGLRNSLQRNTVHSHRAAFGRFGRNDGGDFYHQHETKASAPKIWKAKTGLWGGNNLAGSSVGQSGTSLRIVFYGTHFLALVTYLFKKFSYFHKGIPIRILGKKCAGSWTQAAD
jgi:hypothetical protein